MTVDRTENFEGPALMTVHFNEDSTSPDATPTTTTDTSTVPTDTTSAPASTRTEIINMKHRQSSEILTNLMKLTKATPVEPSKEDIELGKRLAEEIAEADADRIRSKKDHAEKKRQQALLNAARTGVSLSQVE